MKSLTVFLSEARERISRLPFSLEDFITFCEAMKEYDEDSPAYTKIEQAVTDAYGVDLWSSLRGWVEIQVFRADPEDMFNALQNLPVDRLKRLLGTGSFGTALTLGKDKVIKWMHPGIEMDENDYIFYSHCMKEDSKYFPKVYKLTPRYVIIEKLKAKTSKCIQYHKASKKNITIPGRRPTALWKVAEDMAYDPGSWDESDVKKSINTLSPLEQEFWHWYISAQQEAARTGFEAIDFSANNIGERPDGSVVWFDI